MNQPSKKSWVFRGRSDTLGGPRARRRSQRGGAAVEFAIVLPLFVGLVMGALEYGYFFFSQQVITNAAREGARAGSISDPALGFSPTAHDLAQNAAYNYMTGNGVGCSCSPAFCPFGGTGAQCVSVTQTTPTAGVNAIDVVMCCDAVSLTGLFTPPNPFFPKKIYSHSVMRWQ